MGRRRRCAGCKNLLFDHSFGHPSSKCEGPEEDAIDLDSPAEVDEGDNNENDLRPGNIQATLPELPDPVAAQRQKNNQLREELAALEKEHELTTLEEEGAVLAAQLQRRKAALTTKRPSASAELIPSTSLRPVTVVDDLRKDEALQDRVAQHLAPLETQDDCSSASEGADEQDYDSDDSKRAF